MCLCGVGQRATVQPREMFSHCFFFAALRFPDMCEVGGSLVGSSALNFSHKAETGSRAASLHWFQPPFAGCEFSACMLTVNGYRPAGTGHSAHARSQESSPSYHTLTGGSRISSGGDLQCSRHALHTRDVGGALSRRCDHGAGLSLEGGVD